MQTPISVLFLATGNGRRLVDDIYELGYCSHLLNGSDNAPEPYVTQALLEVDQKPIINHWLICVQKCPRLQPMQEKVFVLGNNNNHAELQAWAADPTHSHGGFPVSNVLSTGRTAAEYQGPISDIATFLAMTGLTGQHLLVMESDCLPGPNFHLQHFVEHAYLRERDVLTSFVPAAGVNISGRVGLGFLEGESAPPRDLALRGVSDGTSTSVAGPLFFLRNGTLSDLAGPAGAAFASAPAEQQLIQFLVSRLDSYPLHVSAMDLAFDVKSLEGFAATDSFYKHYAAEERKARRPAGPAKIALQQVTSAYMTMTAGRNGLAATQLSSAMDPPSSLREQYERFMASFDAMAALKASTMTTSKLPTRFTDPSTWKDVSKSQHPVYSTTNNDYGKLKPGVTDMPPSWAGTKGQFTKTFIGMPQPTSLVTSYTNSKVHKALDDY